MMSKEEREYRERRQRYAEFVEVYRQLSPWNKFKVRTHMSWLLLKHRIKTLPVWWVESQIKLDQEIERHGMPYWVKRKLEKWFNYRPHKDDEYFLNQGRKIWYHCFVEVDNFELHLYYKGHFPGNIWYQPETDGTATIISIHIQKEFRNTGLGTLVFQESVKRIRGKVTCLKGVLEKEYYPDPEPSLRWLHRQGFETKQRENGDYDLVLWLNC